MHLDSNVTVKIPAMNYDHSPRGRSVPLCLYGSSEDSYMGQHGKSYRSRGALGLGECCEFIVPQNGHPSDWSAIVTLEIENLSFEYVFVCASACQPCAEIWN